jgi:DNA-binding transcriptional LysR family regulator
MELRQLKYFVSIAKFGSFRAAAASLHVAQPALSRQIKRLEREVGSVLFDRARTGIRLSDAGRTFLEGAERVLDNAELAVQQLKARSTGQTGPLRIAFSEVVSVHGIFPDSVRDFRTAAPNVRLTLLQMTSVSQFDALREGHVDVAFMYGCPVTDAEFGCHKVGEGNVVIALREDHSLAKRKVIYLKDLRSYPLIFTLRENNPLFYDSVTTACMKNGLTPVVDQETTSWAAILTMVSAGMGIGFVASPMQWRRPAEVVLRTVQDLNIHFDISLVWHQRTSSALARRFITSIMERRDISPSTLLSPLPSCASYPDSVPVGQAPPREPELRAPYWRDRRPPLDAMAARIG